MKKTLKHAVQAHLMYEIILNKIYKTHNISNREGIYCSKTRLVYCTVPFGWGISSSSLICLDGNLKCTYIIQEYSTYRIRSLCSCSPTLLTWGSSCRWSDTCIHMEYRWNCPLCTLLRNPHHHLHHLVLRAESWRKPQRLTFLSTWKMKYQYWKIRERYYRFCRVT